MRPIDKAIAVCLGIVLTVAMCVFIGTFESPEEWYGNWKANNVQAKELVHEQEVEIVKAEHEYPLVFVFEDDVTNCTLKFEHIEDIIVCDKSPKEAVEIMYRYIVSKYADVNDYDKPIRFPEPND